MEQSFLSIRESAETTQAQTLKQTVEEVMRDFQRLLSKEKLSAGLTTGFEELDKKSGGLKPGEMFVVAARPSMGKTSFMMNIVENICLDQGKPCMVFSCEMSSAQLVQRLLFARAKFAASQLSRGYTPKKQELERVRNSSVQIVNSKLFIDDTAGISINELRAKARRKKRDEDIQFIAIDYLQLMKSRTKQAENSREREIAEISGGIKALAKELHIPILILAQLNRGHGRADRKKPGCPAYVGLAGIRFHRAGRRPCRPTLPEQILRGKRRGARRAGRQGGAGSREKP